jgi:hypothetical protein
MTGTLVYAAIVIVVNLKILHMTNANSFVTLILVILSIGSFWFVFLLTSMF